MVKVSISPGKPLSSERLVFATATEMSMHWDCMTMAVTEKQLAVNQQTILEHKMHKLNRSGNNDEQTAIYKEGRFEVLW